MTPIHRRFPRNAVRSALQTILILAPALLVVAGVVPDVLVAVGAAPPPSTAAANAGDAAPFPSPHHRAPGDTIRWEPFVLDVGGEEVQAELGRLRVPEVRSRSEAREIELAFVRLESRAAEPGAPIVYLDGGPGGSGYGIARVPAYYRLFDRLRDLSDVILLSQRGTGLSEPALVCPLGSAMPPDLFMSRDRMLEALIPEVEACADRWRSGGADLAGYTTRESADDLEALRRALGADALNLLGFSYGTHLALAALRRHGGRIRRAVLIGTEGPDDTYKLPNAGDRQLRHLSALVAADPDAASIMTNLWFPEVCAVVPEARLDEGFRAPLVSEVPTLFLSGTLDANTPPYQAYEAAWGWPQATHIVVDRAGHEALMPHPPAQEVIASFFEGADVSGREIPSPGLEFYSLEEVLEAFAAGRRP